MTRTATLGQLLADLRNEVGDTPDPAQGQNTRAGYVRLLQRHQETLYLENDWPALKTHRDISLRAGQRYYDIPDDFDLESLKTAAVRWATAWVGIERGIGNDQYAELESSQTPAAGSFTITAGTAAAATGGFTVTAGTLGGSNVITQVAVDATSLLASPVAWGTSHSATARSVATAINARTETTGYTASAVGAAVTITADPDDGPNANGRVVSVTVGGDVTVASVSNLSGGANSFISSVKVDGLDILNGAAVGWRTSNSATASAVAARINETLTIPAYTAEAIDNQVVIYASPENEGTGNGEAVTVTVAGVVTVGTPVDMDGGILSQRADPAQRWEIVNVNGDEQIEVWPVPATNDAVLRIYGQLALASLVEDSDHCTLDRNMLVLFAAAEVLEGRKAGKGKAKFNAAIRHLNRLKGRQKKGGVIANLAGCQDTGRKGRTEIRVAHASTE